MFDPQIEGTLMELAEAPETRYRYIIWFDYTRQSINKIQEGTLVAVPNFASDSQNRHYSILEITTILPTHYALQGSSTGYPGFVVEAARSAAQDWETQDTSSTEDTTKIRVVAIPTNLEIIEPTLQGEPQIGAEINIPMVGSHVKVLDTEYSNLIANNGIDEKEKNLTKIGTMTRDENVNILLRIEELFRTHFAIFGFTGVGKSNLLSTIVSKVFLDSKEPVKLVFFDLMSEYTALLIDQLLNDEINGRILTIGRHTLPEGVFSYINDLPNKKSLDEATEQLSRYTLLPKALLRERDRIQESLRELIEKKNIRYFNEAQSLTVWDLFFTNQIPWKKDRKAEKWNARKDLTTKIIKSVISQNFKNVVFTPQIASDIKQAIEKALSEKENQEFAKDKDFEPKISKLNELEKSTKETFAAGTTLSDLIQDINDGNHSSLWLVQAHNPNELRAFAKRLGEEIYEKRRLSGLIEPLSSFIFDEADEFIKRDATGTFQDSAEIAQTLARRGRKFGLGVGIATQRIRYLDTNIMAQPHTYFVSKLPRKSDREAVCEAFGISDELLNQTFKFKKGDWLLMSHDATGLEAVPIPIHTPDANERITGWLNNRYGNSNQQ